MRVTFTDEELGLLHARGLTDAQAARRFGVSEVTVWERRKGMGLPTNSAVQPPRQDLGRLRALHAQGMTDLELAREFGVSVSTIGNRRRVAGLKCNRAGRSIDVDRLRALHAEGLRDKAIAKEMQCTVNSVRGHRVRMGLAAHGRDMLWTPARLERLRDLIAQGQTSAEVARLMGMEVFQVRDGMFRHDIASPQARLRYTPEMDEAVIAGVRAGEKLASIARRVDRTESSVKQRVALLRREGALATPQRAGDFQDGAGQHLPSGPAAGPVSGRVAPARRAAHRVDLDRLADRHGADLVQALTGVKRSGAYNRLADIASAHQKPIRLVETLWHQVRA